VRQLLTVSDSRAQLVEAERDTASTAHSSKEILQTGIDQEIDVVLKELSQATY
jgi:hypothetical protein